MPHIIRHTFKCDICAFSVNPPYDDNINHPHQSRSYERWYPSGFNFIEGKLICYKHRILVEHNGDMVTVKEAQT